MNAPEDTSEKTPKVGNVPRDLSFLFEDLDEFDDTEESEEESSDAVFHELYYGAKHPKDTVEGWEGLPSEVQQHHLKLFRKECARLRQAAKRKRDTFSLKMERKLDPPMPRPFSMIPDKESLIKVGMEFATRDLLQLRVMELCEKTGNVPTFKKTASSFTAVTVPPEGVPATPLFVHATLDRRSECWKVLSLTIPSLGATDLGKAPRKTAYTADMLAPALHQLYFENVSPDKKSCKAVLSNYLRGDASPSLLQLTMEKARETVYGKPEVNVRYLERLVQHLTQPFDDGSGVPVPFARLSTFDPDAMCTQVRNFRLHEHKKEEAQKKRKLQSLEKEIRHSGRNPVNEATLEEREKMEELKPVSAKRFLESWMHNEKVTEFFRSVRNGSRTFLKSLFIAFPGGMEASGDLLRLYMLDGAHGRKDSKDFMLLSIVGLSSNKEIVPLAVAWVAMNECDEAWAEFLEFFKTAWASINEEVFDSNEHTIISDQDILSACNITIRNIHLFHCSRHRKDNLLKTAKGEGASFFKGMVGCVLPEQLRELKESAAEKLSPEALKYVFRLDGAAPEDAVKAPIDEQQFPAAAIQAGARLYGYSTSSTDEAWNAKMLQARAMDPFAGALALLRFDAQMYMKHRTRSRGHQRYLPPKVQEAVEATIDKATESKMHVAQLSQTKFTVKSNDKDYTVKLSNNAMSRFGSCTCGVPAFERLPCKHMMAVALQQNIPPHRVVPEEFSLDTWKQQIRTAEVLPIARHEICTGLPEHMSSLELPLAGPPEKERPAEKRRRSATEGPGRRKNTRLERRMGGVN